MTKERRTSRRAFSLVEAVCTIAILGTLSVLSSRIILQTSGQYLDAVTRAEVFAELSTAMEVATSELRGVRVLAGSSPPAPDLAAVTPTSIAWNSDSGARSISLSGTDLVLASGGATSILQRNVTSMTVRAYDNANAALGATLSGSALLPVQRVELEVTVTRAGVTETFRTRVALRATLSGIGS